MPKVGAEYRNSGAKHQFDLLILAGLRPGLVIAKTAIHLTGGRNVPPTYQIKRVGTNGYPFLVEKLTVDDPETGLPRSALAARFAKLGIDEFAQVANIRKGEMNVAGRRPLDTEDHFETRSQLPRPLRNRWDEVVDTTLPGILSSYALWHHTHPEPDPNEAEVRAEMDIRDAQEDSWRSNWKLVQAVVQAGLERRLR